MDQTVEEMAADVRAALREKLGLRGKTLAAQLRRGGRFLPRYVRRDATYLAQILPLAGNPKLVRMIDAAKAKDAHGNVLAHLDTIDLGARRRDAALGIIASIAFALLVTGVLAIVVLWWRGFI